MVDIWWGLGFEALENETTGDVDSFCALSNLSEAFQRLLLRLMAGAIWSTPRGHVGDFPAAPAHPQLDEQAVAAQSRWSEISGRRHTHYCGAYWRYGLHEDGAWSGNSGSECGTGLSLAVSSARRRHLR